VIVYRHCDPRFPLLWETPNQPSARWHLDGDGPAHYFADTPDGAWAEFLRHEGITDPADLDGIQRAFWAVDLRHPPTATSKLPVNVLTGGLGTYALCQQEASRLRNREAKGFRAPSAALQPDGATGWVVDKGLRSGPSRHGVVYVLFGPQPSLVGWMATYAGRPPDYLLQRVRPL
jgi:hypothetical protein